MLLRASRSCSEIWRFTGKAGPFAIALAFLLFANGCAQIKASLALRPQIAIKVPGDTNQIPAGGFAQTNNWIFVHVAECLYDTREHNRIVEDKPSQWYVAFSTDPSRNKYPRWWNHCQYRKIRKRLPGVADAAKMQFGVFPTTCEAVNVFDPSTFMGRLHNTGATNRVMPALSLSDVSNLQVHDKPHISWPVGGDGTDPPWHLRSAYTQLEDARARVNNGRATNEPWHVRVGIIDTGFSGVHSAAPRFIDEEQETSDAWNWISCKMPRKSTLTDTNACKVLKPSDTEGSHGTGTIGILAAPSIVIAGRNGATNYQGPLGAIPEATIVPVRVAPWVVSINTANFAYALDYASRVKGCDVISMSHGGAPSMLWYDAINSAYWRGTVMVAASGDFISYGTFKRALFPPPSTPIYPAAARRVLSVTGVTADTNSYAAPKLGGFFKGLLHFKFFDSYVRGSYGADGSWRNVLGSDEIGDTVAARRQGPLRIHPIAAPSPNIPWLVAASDVKGKTNLIDLDGGGTSAATPQVAAAAAIWLEHNQRYWTNLPATNRWIKAEATYQALLRTAQRPTNFAWPNKYLGAGLLKANDALDRSFDDIVRAGADYKFDRFQRSPRDFFDGAKSLNGIFRRLEGDIGEDDSVTAKMKDQLKPPPTPTTPRDEALYRCFYNTRMLEAWHQGYNPTAAQLKDMAQKAHKDATKALGP